MNRVDCPCDNYSLFFPMIGPGSKRESLAARSLGGGHLSHASAIAVRICDENSARHRSRDAAGGESEGSENRRKALGEGLSVLNHRERCIFEARRLADDPIRLDDLASKFGVSRERVRQIEVRAFEKVQKAVKNRVASAPLPVQ